MMKNKGAMVRTFNKGEMVLTRLLGLQNKLEGGYEGPSVDDLVKETLRLGKGAVMAMVDVSQAYRNVRVNWHLLGMEWEGNVYVDGTLPFGLRSAPLLFTALGDAIQWSMEEAGWATIWRFCQCRQAQCRGWWKELGNPKAHVCRMWAPT